MALESLPKIAPALFSAEQDLIQIYNKKSDTVGTINASYIGGSTPPSGVSGAIQFSNGSAFASDASNLFWDDTNNRLGIGTNAPTQSLEIGGNNNIKLNNDGSLYLNSVRYATNNGSIYVGDINATNTAIYLLPQGGGVNGSIRLGGGQVALIKGSGSTAATTALLVQNSLGTEYLKVLDNGDATMHRLGLNSALKVEYINTRTDSYTAIQLNSTNGNVYFPQAVSIGTNTAVDKFQVKTTQANSNGSILFGNNNAATILATTDTGSALTQLQFRASSYNFTDCAGMRIASTGYANVATAMLQVIGSGSTSATTSLLVQNSLGNNLFKIGDSGLAEFGSLGGGGGAGVNAPIFRSAYYNSFGDNFTIFQTSNSTGNAYFYQSLSIGTGVEPTARVHIKGSGSTSATNSLIIQNSSGIQIMKVPDATSQRVEFGVDVTAGTFFGQVYIPGKLFLKSSGEAVFGDDSLNSSAVLQANSTTRGFLPPRMTDAQIRAIVSPANGLVAYNTDINHLCCYQAGAWVKFNHSPM